MTCDENQQKQYKKGPLSIPALHYTILVGIWILHYTATLDGRRKPEENIFPEA
jgi:hypothetical protein